MAISINKVTLLGRLGRDPERRGDRGPVVFSMATSETWRDKSSGEKRERVQWTNVAVWNEHNQKFLLDYAKKGDQVYVEGQLETREYEKDGEKRYATEVVIRPFGGTVQLQSKEKRDAGDREPDDEGERFGGRQPRMADGGGSMRDVMDDEIPF